MDLAIASRKRRIAAFLMDFLLFGYLTSSATYFVFVTLKTPLDTPALHDFSVQLLIWLLGIILFAAKDSYKGLGPGKLLMGVRAYSTDGKPAGVVKQFMRNISLFAWPIEALVMILNSNKRRLGDYLANTKVLRDPTINSTHRGFAALFVVVFYFASPDLPEMDFTEDGFMQLTQYMVKQSQAYGIAEQHIHEQDGIKQLVGPVLDIQVRGSSNLMIENDAGHADFILLVIGEDGELPVRVSLDRDDNQWQLTSLTYEQTQNIPVK